MKRFYLPRISSIGGCCGKVSPKFLNEILCKLRQTDILSGIYQDSLLNNDCALHRIDDNTSLAVTIDFMHSPVLETDIFGAIAACNALSDIYTLGVMPNICLNILGLPDNVDSQVVESIHMAGISKINEAGAILVGGHTLRNHDFIYGFSVIAVIQNNKYWNFINIKPTDRLLLTKPLGIGVTLGAKLKGLISSVEADNAISYATTLNKAPVEALQNIPVSAATDVTGFGFIGHLSNLANDANVAFTINFNNVPILPEAIELYNIGATTSLTQKNKMYYGGGVMTLGNLTDTEINCMYDPQTNGGLVICVPETHYLEATVKLSQKGVFYKDIGYVTEYTGHRVVIKKDN